jgi:2-oxo-hept-3-ene-1,7-dioate hydratase
MDRATVRELAIRLEEAEKSRTQIRQFSLDYPEITIEDAYSIQHAWLDLKRKAGRKLKGHKIGLTSKAMQYSSNTNPTTERCWTTCSFRMARKFQPTGSLFHALK